MIQMAKDFGEKRPRIVLIGILIILLSFVIFYIWPEEDFTGRAVKFSLSEDYPLFTMDDPIEKIMPHANKGNVFAQSALSIKYSVGLGVERNGIEALKWMKAAAEQGFARAMDDLGTFLLAGKVGVELGIGPDYIEAYKWLLLADKFENIDTESARKRIAKKMTRDDIAKAKMLARAWQPRRWDE